jgi:hypothetical protein
MRDEKEAVVLYYLKFKIKYDIISKIKYDARISHN